MLVVPPLPDMAAPPLPAPASVPVVPPLPVSVVPPVPDVLLVPPLPDWPAAPDPPVPPDDPPLPDAPPLNPQWMEATPAAQHSNDVTMSERDFGLTTVNMKDLLGSAYRQPVKMRIKPGPPTTNRFYSLVGREGRSCFFATSRREILAPNARASADNIHQ
jgi:hypothetical protein